MLILKIKSFHSPFLYLQKLNTKIILIFVKGRYSHPTKNNIMHLQPKKVKLQLILLGIINYNTSKCNKQLFKAHWWTSYILAFSTSICSAPFTVYIIYIVAPWSSKQFIKYLQLEYKDRDRHSYLQWCFNKEYFHKTYFFSMKFQLKKSNRLSYKNFDTLSKGFMENLDWYTALSKLGFTN